MILGLTDKEAVRLDSIASQLELFYDGHNDIKHFDEFTLPDVLRYIRAIGKVCGENSYRILCLIDEELNNNPGFNPDVVEIKFKKIYDHIERSKFGDKQLYGYLACLVKRAIH